MKQIKLLLLAYGLMVGMVNGGAETVLLSLSPFLITSAPMPALASVAISSAIGFIVPQLISRVYPNSSPDIFENLNLWPQSLKRNKFYYFTSLACLDLDQHQANWAVPIQLPNGRVVHWQARFKTNDHARLTPKAVLIEVYGGNTGLHILADNPELLANNIMHIKLHLPDELYTPFRSKDCILTSQIDNQCDCEHFAKCVSDKDFVQLHQADYTQDQINELQEAISISVEKIKTDLFSQIGDLQSIAFIYTGGSFGASLGARIAASQHQNLFDGYFLRNGAYMRKDNASRLEKLTYDQLDKFTSRPVTLITSQKMLQPYTIEEYGDTKACMKKGEDCRVDAQFTTLFYNFLRAKKPLTQLYLGFVQNIGHYGSFAQEKTRNLLYGLIDRVRKKQTISDIDQQAQGFERVTQEYMPRGVNSLVQHESCYKRESDLVSNILTLVGKKKVPDFLHGNMLKLFRAYLQYLQPYGKFIQEEFWCTKASSPLTIEQVFVWPEKGLKPYWKIKAELGQIHRQNRLIQPIDQFIHSTLEQSNYYSKIAYGYAKFFYDNYFELLQNDDFNSHEKLIIDNHLSSLAFILNKFEKDQILSERYINHILDPVLFFEEHIFQLWLEKKEEFCQNLPMMQEERREQANSWSQTSFPRFFTPEATCVGLYVGLIASLLRPAKEQIRIWQTNKKVLQALQEEMKIAMKQASTLTDLKLVKVKYVVMFILLEDKLDQAKQMPVIFKKRLKDLVNQLKDQAEVLCEQRWKELELESTKHD